VVGRNLSLTVSPLIAQHQLHSKREIANEFSRESVAQIAHVLAVAKAENTLIHHASAVPELSAQKMAMVLV
jgi:hypothetical protein